MKLCIFPNDPIISYYKKGEIKERYFNPKQKFDEVHIISFTDNDIEEEKVKTVVGNAKLEIHSVGKINLKNYRKNKKRMINLVKSINPDIIRAYNPLIEGWFAAVCSKELKIPFFLSLHTQYDRNREIAKSTNFKKYLVLKYTQKFIEPYVLKSADCITIVYRIIEPYVLKHVKKNPILLYNRINIERFSNGNKIDSLPSPLIISVGNLIKEKNHQCLIKAMKNLEAYCLIIGDGNQNDELKNLIKKEKLENKIIMKNRVPHDEIQNYYKSAKIFALAYDPELEGLPMPVMEAMASGLPVIIPYPKKHYSDGLEDVATFSKRDPQSYAMNIDKLLNNEKLYSEISKKLHNKVKEFEDSEIEEKESEIYSELVSKK